MAVPTLLFVVFLIFAEAQGLKPGGTNVLTKYQIYYTPQTYTTKEVAYRRTCWQSCTLWIFCTTRCRTVSYYRWVVKSRLIKKTRPVYECKPGWSPSGDHCTIPICTLACQNSGVCKAPNLCNCTVGWNGSQCQTDLDECHNGYDHNCQDICVNTPGSYKCACSKGHYLASNGKNCTDHDECAGNIHGCAQDCINYPGGYNCTCRSGYNLNRNDFKSCNDIDECRQNISGCSQVCTNRIGHYSCSCDIGYSLGDDLKSCGRIYCPVPPTPSNGFVYFPCNTVFASDCIVGCARGYYVQGTNKISCVGNGVWKPRNVECKVIESCEPNPCQNGGKCSPIGTSSYACDCSRTGYKGSNCQVGVIITPKYPVLVAGVPSPPLRFLVSPPSDHIILTPSGRGLVFDPSRLLVNSTSLEQTLTIKAKQRGIHYIRYVVSGPNAVDFEVPQLGVVLAETGNATNKPSDGPPSRLPVGCFELEANKCPKGDDVIVTPSTSPWRVLGPITSTSGVVMVKVGETVVPLSLVGTSVQTSGLPSHDEHCKSKGNYSVEDLIKEHALPRTFLETFQDSFPKWLYVNAPQNYTVKQFSLSDLKAYFLTGEKLRQHDVGRGHPLTDNSSFLLLLSPSTNLTVENNLNILGSFFNQAPLAVAVELCSETPKNVILRPSTKDATAVNNISVFRRLKESGWDLTVTSVQISKTKSIKKLTTGLSWDGNSFVHALPSAKGNLALVSSLEKSFTNQDFVKCYLKFDGTLLMDVQEIDNILQSPLDQKWVVDLYGDMKLTVELKLEGKTTNVTFNGPESISYAMFGGPHREGRSLESNGRQGLYFSHTLDQSPFLHSEWSKFLELGQNKTIYLFLKTKLQSSKTTNVSGDMVNGVSMAFQGRLKFGPLRFNEDFIKVDISNSPWSNMSALSPRSTGTEPNGSRRETVSKKFSIFSTSPSNPRVYISSEIRERSSGSFQSRVRFLGFEKRVNVSFSHNGLRFNTSGKAHGLYDVSVTCHSDLASWENQKFVAAGEFTAGPSLLVGALDKAMYEYGKRIVSRALRRVALIKEREKTGNERLKKAASFAEQKRKEKDEALEDYKTAERKLDAAKIRLKDVEGNVSGRLDNLKTKLTRLCKVKQCHNICREGVVCKQCVYDIVGKTKETCLRNCTKMERRVAQWNSSLRPCWTQDCQRVYLKSGLSRKRLEEIFQEMTTRMYSHGKRASDLSSRSSSSVTQKYTARFSPGKRKADACSSGSRRTAFCRNDDRAGHWDCRDRLTTCATAVFKTEQFHKTYTCEQPCERHVTRELIPKSCCSLDTCAFSIANLTCVAENTLCRKIRSDALGKVFVANSSLSVLKMLQDARANVAYWEIMKERSSIRLASALNSLNMTKASVENLGRAQNVTMKAAKNISKLLTWSLKVKGYLNEEQKSLALVKFDSIKFRVEMSRKYQTVLPVRIAFKLNGHQKALDSVLDFGNFNESTKTIVKEILDMYIWDFSGHEGTSARRRRSASNDTLTANDTAHHVVSRLMKYHELCSEHTNYEQALYDIVHSLYNLTSEAKQLFNSITANTSKPLNLSKIFDDLEVNDTVSAHFGLNISKNMFLRRLETDPVFLASNDLQNEVADDVYKPVYLTSKLHFRNWYSAMENIFNVVSKQCSGFEDCILYIVDGLNEMYQSLDSPGAQRTQQQVKEVETRLLNLTQSADMSVSDAADLSWRILDLLKSITDVNTFCSHLPNITKHPAPFTEIGMGQRLLLTCNATGDSLVYKWRLNDEILPDQTSNVLLIENTTRSNAGNYTCGVSNRVGMETSTPALVVVHSAPFISVQPAGRLNVVISRNNSLRCEAQSSDYNMTYQWWFRSRNSTTFTPLMNESFPRLNIAPMKASREGWYYCNVSNKYGFNASKTSFVKALRFSLPVPVLALSFALSRNPSHKDSLLQDSQPINQYKRIQAKLEEIFQAGRDNTSNAAKPKDLRITDCDLVKSQAVPTRSISERCQWSSQYVGENVTKNSSQDEMFLRNAQSVSDAAGNLDKNLGKLLDATNNGSLGFGLGNESYVVERNSMIVEDFALVCSRGQKMIQEDFMCVDCSPGFYGTNDGNLRTSCQPCPVGSYQANAGQTSCNTCPEGFTTIYQASYDKKQCKVICPVGYYGEILGTIARCRECPANTYQPKAGQFDCLSCPNGRVTTTEGADDISKCIMLPTTRQSTTPSKKQTTPSKKQTTQEPPLTEGTGEVQPTVAELKSSKDGSNHAALIGGVVGGCIVLAIIAGLLLLLLKKRRSPKGNDSLSKKEIGSPHAFKLNDWHDNPAFIDDNDFVHDGVGSSAISPSYEFGASTVNPTYEPGWSAPVQNGGQENPMYDSYGEADKGVKNMAHDVPLHEDEVEPYHGQDGATTFGNPLYESFRGDDQKPKDVKLTLTDEVVVDEDV